LPETVKYGRCELSNVVSALGALTNGDVGLNATSRLSLFVNTPVETLR